MPERIVLIQHCCDNLRGVSRGDDRGFYRLTVNVPMRNIPNKIALFFFGSFTLKSKGIGMQMMIKSEEMLRTAFVIKWFEAAEHCATDLLMTCLSRG
jgi:hypothetical protein